jgi:hypothetical protein
MPNLAEHMLRVAAVASLICDNFDELLPKEDIVTACLLHDMGNIIKAEFEFLPESWEPEGIAYWQKVKKDYIKKYGDNEHHATIRIMKELRIPENIIHLVDQIDFSLFCRHRDGNDIQVKIITYADTRVDPHGVVSQEERLEEARRRYATRNKGKEEERQRLVVCSKDIEKQIFAKCSLRPEDITDESAAPVIAELKNFVVK